MQAPWAAAANPLEVSAWVDHPDNTYAYGERVRLFVQTNKDAWVTVLNVGPDGTATVLFPNRFQGDNRVRANAVTEVPDPAARARIEVSGTTGTELVKVIASSRPVPLFDVAQLARAGPFQTLLTRADETARNLSVVMESDEWHVCDKVIRTVPRRPAASTPAVAPVAGAGWPSPPFALEIAPVTPRFRLRWWRKGWTPPSRPAPSRAGLERVRRRPRAARRGLHQPEHPPDLLWSAPPPRRLARRPAPRGRDAGRLPRRAPPPWSGAEGKSG